MKVKIAYAVQFDKIASKMSGLIKEAQHMFPRVTKKHELCVDMLSDDVSATKCQVVEELIHEIRLDLSEMDQTLSDCSSILEGYRQALVQEEASGQTAPVAEQSPPQPADVQRDEGLNDANEG